MYKAKLALQLSKFDQENLALKIEEWKQHTDDTHFLRLYICDTDVHVAALRPQLRPRTEGQYL